MKKRIAASLAASAASLYGFDQLRRYVNSQISETSKHVIGAYKPELSSYVPHPSDPLFRETLNKNLDFTYEFAKANAPYFLLGVVEIGLLILSAACFGYAISTALKNRKSDCSHL
jgi:hypothetical protein